MRKITVNVLISELCPGPLTYILIMKANIIGHLSDVSTFWLQLWCRVFGVRKFSIRFFPLPCVCIPPMRLPALFWRIPSAHAQNRPMGIPGLDDLRCDLCDLHVALGRRVKSPLSLRSNKYGLMMTPKNAHFFSRHMVAKCSEWYFVIHMSGTLIVPVHSLRMRQTSLFCGSVNQTRNVKHSDFGLSCVVTDDLPMKYSHYLKNVCTYRAIEWRLNCENRSVASEITWESKRPFLNRGELEVWLFSQSRDHYKLQIGFTYSSTSFTWMGERGKTNRVR